MLVLLITAGTWLGVRAVLARASLLEVRAAAVAATSDLRAGRLESAERHLVRATRAAGRAKSLTGDPLWRAAGHLPLAGNSLKVTRTIAVVTDELTRVAAPQLLNSARRLDAATDGAPSGTIRLDRVRGALAPATAARKSVTQAFELLNRSPTNGVLGQVSAGRREFSGELSTLSTGLGDFVSALRYAPDALGGDGPRRYFLGFQSLAEVRATGGLIGAYGILTADQGRLAVGMIGSTSTDLRSPVEPVVDLGPEFRSRYARFAAAGFWSNVNVSPHFPFTDEIVRGLWRRQTGQTLDGTIALDSVALSHLLGTAGPVTVSTGEVVSADNVVSLSVRDAYLRYDERRQDAFILALARASADRLLAGVANPLQLFLALSRAADDGHLRMAARDPGLQRFLEDHTIGGALPEGRAPVVGVALNNAGATKLDYYLTGRVVHRTDGRTATTEVRLRSTVDPRDLPQVGGTSVGGLSPDDPASPPGRNRVHVSVYATAGAVLRAGSLDGVPFVREPSLPGQPWILGKSRTLLEPGTERGLTVVSTFVDLDPGGDVQLRIEWDMPATTGPTRIFTPPLVSPFVVEVITEGR